MYNYRQKGNRRVTLHPPQVIYRSTLEHPFHCLYVVLALSNATKDDQFPKSGYVTGTSHKNTAGSRLRNSVSPSSIDEVSSVDVL